MKIDAHARFPLPWKVHPARSERIVAANGQLVAICVGFEESSVGVLPECELHASALVEAYNIYHRPLGPREGIIGVSVYSMQELVIEWADRQFPTRTPAKAFLKLYEELGEVVSHPENRLEWADVFIVLLDLAHLFGHHDIYEAVVEKLLINSRRTWTEGGAGVMKGSDEYGSKGADDTRTAPEPARQALAHSTHRPGADGGGSPVGGHGAGVGTASPDAQHRAVGVIHTSFGPARFDGEYYRGLADAGEETSD